MKDIVTYINEQRVDEGLFDFLKKLWSKLFNNDKLTEEEITNMKFLFNYVSSTEQAIFLYNKGNTDTACPVKDMVDYFNDYGEILNNTLSKWNKNEKFETGNTDLKQLVSRNKELINIINTKRTKFNLYPGVEKPTGNQRELGQKLKNFIYTVLCYNVGVNKETCEAEAKDTVGITKFLEKLGYKNFKLSAIDKGNYVYYTLTVNVPAGGELPARAIDIPFRIEYTTIKVEK